MGEFDRAGDGDFIDFFNNWIFQNIWVHDGTGLRIYENINQKKTGRCAQFDRAVDGDFIDFWIFQNPEVLNRKFDGFGSYRRLSKVHGFGP